MKKFKTFKNGYKFNRVLGKAVFILIFLLMIPQLVWLFKSAPEYGFYSFSCTGNSDGVVMESSCINPFYGKCNNKHVEYICNQSLLPVGFSHNPVPFFYDWYQLPTIFLLFGFLVFNHFKYNKNFWRD